MFENGGIDVLVIKRSTAIAAIFAVFMIIVGSAYFFGEASVGSEKTKVIIDAGHGNPDGGAVGVGGTVEKDINLAIALKLSEVLDGKGYTVIMTRTGDNGIYDSDCKTIREMKRNDMNNRLSIMKRSGADLFVSIHMNSFENTSAEGLHVFYSENHDEIKQLAESIQRRVSEVTGAKAHTVKTADKRLFLMKNPPLPSILVECGFLSNVNEEKKLCTDEYQSKLAWAIADAIDDEYQ